MRWQTTAVVALLLALVGGFYVYDLWYLTPAREKGESEKNRLWTVEAKDIEEVVLERSPDTVRLKRAGEGWQMLEPVRATGAKAAIEDVIASIANAKMDREVAAAPSALQEFGLDKPATRVKLTVKGKTEPLSLGLGATSPTGVWVYAKKPEAPAVFVVSESVLREATKPCPSSGTRPSWPSIGRT
jgi:hypothetical protein